MKYREDRAGNRLSVLGFGCMRLPQKGRGIDLEEAEREIMEAYHAGVNYFDTAWFYHGGNSERFAGRALKKYPRDSYYIADKFPGVVPNNWDKVEEIPAEVFQQVIERYDNCIREILSMDFEKTPLRRRRDIDEYYYTINRKNGKAIFGRVINEYLTKQITVYPSGYSFNSCICNTDYMPAKARYYNIDPMTFQKVQKMHDVLNSTLLTLINSYLE